MKNLHIHCFQHVPFEGLGCIENWSNEKGHSLTFTKFYKEFNLPKLSEIDWLIIMGGPMGVYDEDKFEWMKEEKIFIKQTINANKTVIGVCLGSQLIAHVLGAEIYPNPYKEIGWFNVSLTPKGQGNYLLDGFEKSFKVFHWHGDTFDLPNGAKHFLYSEACINQMFLYKNNVLGLQFHCEVTNIMIREMVRHGNHELVPEKHIQTEKIILTHEKFINKNNQKIYSILNKLNE